jgi:hypothetical protein
LEHDRPKDIPTKATRLVPAAEVEHYKKALGIALEALRFYADPESYHAIAFMVDRPAGGFADDFSKNHGHDFYDRPMPGKIGRAAIKKLENNYGDLKVR